MKTKYTDEDLGELQVIPDFLPSPEELAFKEDTVKVTISLSKNSVDFFKKEARKHKTQYQKIIRVYWTLIPPCNNNHKKGAQLDALKNGAPVNSNVRRPANNVLTS